MRVERTALPRVLLSKQEDLKCKKNVRYFFWLLLVFLATSICYAQEIIADTCAGIRANRHHWNSDDIPLDQSPASISVVTSQDFEEKQIERVADAVA